MYKGRNGEVGTEGASPVGQRSESRTVRALRCYRAALMIAFSASAFASARFDPVRRYSFAALFACSISACMMSFLLSEMRCLNYEDLCIACQASCKKKLRCCANDTLLL